MEPFPPLEGEKKEKQGRKTDQVIHLENVVKEVDGCVDIEIRGDIRLDKKMIFGDLEFQLMPGERPYIP